MEVEHLVSVIVPVYNVEKYLRVCLDSILCQTYHNLDVILVDDGSTDESGRLCDEYGNLDNRVRVIHKENGGLASARNVGLDFVKGDYICFVDSDDFIEPSMVENLLESITANCTRIAFCGIRTFDLKESSFGIKDAKIIDRREFWNIYFSDNNILCVVQWNKIYDSTLWESIRYPLGKINEDEFVLTELLDSVNELSYVDKCLYNYRISCNGIMRRPYSEKRLDGIEALLQHVDYFIRLEYLAEAKRMLSKLITYFFVGYFSLSNIRSMPRYVELKKEYRKKLNVIYKKTRDFRFWINGFSFCIHERVYILFHLNRISEIKRHLIDKMK